MDSAAFERLKTDFTTADVDKKINIYSTTEGLNQSQYRELLTLFPRNELSRLEAALQ